MKKLAVIAVSLFSLASTCAPEDTVSRELGRRSFEVRLSETTEYVPCTAIPLQEDEVVPKTRCGEAPPEREVEDACDDVTSSRQEAATILVTRPQCIDRAIRQLERFFSSDPQAATDLAAAYFVRAQREDQPLDFLRALEAAQQAITTGDPAALFNYALIQETLGFTDAAIAAWDRYLEVETSPQWTAEARKRREALARMRTQDARRRWETNRDALPAALEKGDRAAVARLIDPFPRSAWIYFEETVLGQWAKEPTPERVREAQLFAEELSRRTKDRFALDVVARLSPEVREAHRLHSEAIAANRQKPGSPNFATAIALFQRANNPMLLSAKIYSEHPDVDGAARYPYLHAQARAMRGYERFEDDLFLDALSDFEGAQDEYRRLGDPASEFNLYANTLGIHRILRQSDAAAIALFRSRAYTLHLENAQRRNLYLGEASALALDLGFRSVALLYQNENIPGRRAALASATSDGARDNARHNLAIALRSRAGVYAALGQYTAAERDLTEGKETSTEFSLRALQARTAEVEAQTQPDATAVETLSSAIALAGDEYSSFRANLHVQRASRLQRLGRNAEAEQDLVAALELVRAEEVEQLRQQKRKDADQIIWNNYFSRFDEAYDALIDQRITTKRPEEAFDVAEESRAYEPLNRLLKFGTAAGAFRREIGSQTFLTLSQIRKHLPADTLLVAYAVLESKAYAWIVTRDGSDVVELQTGRQTIERWSTDIEDAFRHHSETALQTVLLASYAQLVRPVLARARKPRIVLIPDDAMHGLPFPALHDSQSRQYLVEQAVVSIAPSATLYIHSLLRDRELQRGGDARALLLGNPEFDPALSIARKLKRLSGARREVDQVAHLYPSRAVALTDKDATVTEFLRLAPQSEIVQVAAHGIVNGREPSRSALLLAPDAQSNGVLDAETLLTQFHAERTRLMVLSACSSAGGLPVGSEGVAPLVRPILAAGVPGVVGTLSYIGDATSAELMVSFHRHYRQGSDAASALRNAQVEMATRKGNASALNWAPFQVIGYASSPFAAPETNKGERPP